MYPRHGAVVGCIRMVRKVFVPSCCCMCALSVLSFVAPLFLSPISFFARSFSHGWWEETHSFCGDPLKAPFRNVKLIFVTPADLAKCCTPTQYGSFCDRGHRFSLKIPIILTMWEVTVIFSHVVLLGRTGFVQRTDIGNNKKHLGVGTALSCYFPCLKMLYPPPSVFCCCQCWSQPTSPISYCYVNDQRQSTTLLSS